MPFNRPLTAAAAVVLSLAGLAAGQEVQPAAKEKLQKMVDAFKGVQSLSFSATLRGTGGFMAMLPDMTGDVTLARAETPGAWKQRVEGARAAGMGSPEMRFILASPDGRTKTWIDHTTKAVYERPAGSARGDAVDVASLLVPQEFLAAAPYESYLSSPGITLEAEPAKADGAECDVIRVDSIGPSLDSYRIAIARSDNLPRTIVKLYTGSSEQTQTWYLKNLRANIPTGAEQWKVATPDGYTFSGAPAPLGASPGVTAPASTAPAAPKARSIGVNAGDLAPDFTLKTPEGTEVTLSGLRGQVVLLEFWATWNPQARPAGEAVQALAERFKEQPVKFYGLSVREQMDAAPVGFMRDNNLTYGLLLKADEVSRTYRMRVPPTFFVIGKEGQIVYTTGGFKAEETPRKLAEAIEAALAGREMTPPPAETPAAPASPSAPSDAVPGNDVPTDGAPPAKAPPPAAKPPAPASAPAQPGPGSRAPSKTKKPSSTDDRP